MRNVAKMTLAALASLVLIPTAVTANTVKAPFPGTVTATTYTSTGAFHGALDVRSDSCNSWGVQTSVVGSLYWNVTIVDNYAACFTNSGPNTGNEARHHWADGWTFRILHFLKSDASVDKTCDRCVIGKEGEHTHLQYDMSGTKDTSWYGGYATRGEIVDRTETIGVLD